MGQLKNRKTSNAKIFGNATFVMTALIKIAHKHCSNEEVRRA